MKPFIEEIGNILKISRTDLIEKDIILHRLLLELSRDRQFRSNYLFKGGTCLIKFYLGYFRFSEDLDFTWKDQNYFNGLSSKKLRKSLSEIIDDVGDRFEEISRDIGLDFVCDKSDRTYIELGGSGRMGTFKLWYQSEILKQRNFLKIQINFVEKLIHPSKSVQLGSLLKDSDQQDLPLLFPDEYMQYSTPVKLEAYDIREILYEKVRAILTRRGIKARDFVDLYLLSKQHKLDIKKFKQDIVDKMSFSLDLYEKYRQNFEEKKSIIDSDDFFNWGAEKDLLLIQLNDKEFYTYIKQLQNIFKSIVQELESY
jgi:predicted nucleotidyltransferase component of viral defense system